MEIGLHEIIDGTPNELGLQDADQIRQLNTTAKAIYSRKEPLRKDDSKNPTEEHKNTPLGMIKNMGQIRRYVILCAVCLKRQDG